MSLLNLYQGYTITERRIFFALRERLRLEQEIQKIGGTPCRAKYPTNASG